jgi:hypothetical protein
MRQGLIWLVVAVAAVVPVFGVPVSVNLGTASTFGLLGGTISNTGTSVVTGNVGVGHAEPPSTITGFYPTGTVVGGSVIPPNSVASDNAYIAFVNAFNTSMALAPTQLPYADLTESRTFIGNNVYTFVLNDISTTTGINLTFDALDNPNNVFVIKTAGAFTANGALTFTLARGAQANNIFWVIGTIATISVGSSGPMTFEGNILAGQSFTMSAAAGGSGVLAGTINGCVFSETANTLAGTTNVGGCSQTASAIPEPASSGLVGLGCLLGILAWRRFRGSV